MSMSSTKSPLSRALRVFGWLLGIGCALVLLAGFALAMALSNSGNEDMYRAADDGSLPTTGFTGVLVLGPDAPQVEMPFDSTLREPETSISAQMFVTTILGPPVDEDAVEFTVTPTSDGSGFVTFRLDEEVETEVKVAWTIQGLEQPLSERAEFPTLQLDQPADQQLASYLETFAFEFEDSEVVQVIELIVTTTSPDVELTVVQSGGSRFVLTDRGDFVSDTEIAPPRSCSSSGCTFSIWFAEPPSYRAELHTLQPESVTTSLTVHEFAPRSLELTQEIDIAPSGQTSFDVTANVSLDVPGSEIPEAALLYLSDASVRVLEAVDANWFRGTGDTTLTLFDAQRQNIVSPATYWIDNESGGTTRQIDITVTWLEPVGSNSMISADVDFVLDP